MKNKIKAYKRRDNIAGYVMLAPWLFGFVLMYFLPMLISIYYSFTDYNLLNDAQMIGFDNYVRIFTNDDTFWQALKVTFIYTIFLVPLRLAFALVVAMLLAPRIGIGAVWYAVPIGWAANWLISLAEYRTGRWQKAGKRNGT